MFLALAAVFFPLSFLSEGGGMYFLRVLGTFFGFFAFYFSMFSCARPLLSHNCCLIVRHHICPLCKKVIGPFESCGDRDVVRTPDYLADMA